MPPTSKTAGLAGRLTRKVGPLPVWGWAAAILGAYLLYTRLHPSADTGAAEPLPATPADSNAGPVGVGSNGAGSNGAGVDNDLIGQLYQTNAATIDQLTAALLTQQSYQAAAGEAPGAVAQAGAASTATSSAAAQGAASGHQTQTQSGRLLWDGKVFTTQAGFQAWAKAHGTSPSAIFRNHPQAKAIYSTLK